jgi:hypothetical protein
MFLVERDNNRVRSLSIVLATFLGGIALDLLLCKLYFGTALPLSFYVKSRGGYEGYTDNWHPVLMALQFGKDTLLFLALLLLLVRGQRLVRLAIVFLIPAAVGAIYYTFFVVQIMGFSSRYYLPLLPFVVIPAILSVDDALQRRRVPDLRPWLPRAAAAAALLLVLASMTRLQNAYDRVFGARFAYAAPQRSIAARRSLPNVPWFEAQKRLADEMFAGAPSGVAVASSEVGYLGVRAPQVTVIDLSGLNDEHLAREGFSASYVLSRKPDLIWFPVTLYTAEFGKLYSDPGLLQQYDVLDGALTYGIALRKDSPYRAALEAGLERVWAQSYPGYDMKEYRVQAVHWDGLRHSVRWNGTAYQQLN